MHRIWTHTHAFPVGIPWRPNSPAEEKTTHIGRHAQSHTHLCAKDLSCCAPTPPHRRRRRPSQPPRSSPAWPDADLSTASFTATVVGATLVIDAQWSTDFAWYFKSSPNGTLSAVVQTYTPIGCRPAFSASVTVHAADGRARLVVSLPPELVDCSTGEPVRLAFVVIGLAWVSRAGWVWFGWVGESCSAPLPPPLLLQRARGLLRLPSQWLATTLPW